MPLHLTRTLLASIAMLAAGFCVTALVLHELIRDPLHLYAQMRSEKLALLDTWKDRASVAAFGSSHVDNGFDPRTFDQEMHAHAVATTTLNLGISGGSQTEQEAVARTFIDALPESSNAPRFVLLEITAGANFTPDHLFHPRAINIYGATAIRLAMDLAEGGKIGRLQSAGRSGFALAAGLLHYSNVGMLASLIFPTSLDAQLLSEQTAEDRRGLTPASGIDPRDTRANDELLSGSHISARIPGQVFNGHITLLQDLAAAAERKHVRLVYFVAPSLTNLQTYPVYPPSMTGPTGNVPILNVGIPAAHPELYQAALWHDPHHLTEPGAALFSKLLADELLAREGPNPGLTAQNSGAGVR